MGEGLTGHLIRIHQSLYNFLRTELGRISLGQLSFIQIYKILLNQGGEVINIPIISTSLGWSQLPHKHKSYFRDNDAKKVYLPRLGGNAPLHFLLRRMHLLQRSSKSPLESDENLHWKSASKKLFLGYLSMLFATSFATKRSFPSVNIIGTAFSPATDACSRTVIFNQSNVSPLLTYDSATQPRELYRRNSLGHFGLHLCIFPLEACVSNPPES